MNRKNGSESMIDYYFGVSYPFPEGLRNQILDLRMEDTLEGEILQRAIRQDTQALELDFIQISNTETDRILQSFMNNFSDLCPDLKFIRLVFDRENGTTVMLQKFWYFILQTTLSREFPITIEIYKAFFNTEEYQTFRKNLEMFEHFKHICIKTKVKLRFNHGILTQKDIEELEKTGNIYHNYKCLLGTRVLQSCLYKCYMIREWTCQCLALYGSQSSLFKSIPKVEFPFLLYLFLDTILITSLERISLIYAPHLELFSAKKSQIISMRSLLKLQSKKLSDLNLNNNYIQDFLSLSEIYTQKLVQVSLQQKADEKLEYCNQAVLAKTKICEQNENKMRRTKMIAKLQKRFK